MIFENKVTTVKTARYFLSGKITDDIKNIWIVCHGYGQLAKEFICNFESLSDKETIIAAPEALNRFYCRGSAGTVGASWMTKEDRLSEIDDHIKYLQNVYEEITGKISVSNYKITLLGFSQGSAAMGRWALKCKPEVNNIIFWAGDLPEENLIGKSNGYLRNKNIFIVFGNDDSIASRLNLEMSASRFERHNVKCRILKFDGKHEIHSGTLKIIDETAS